MLKQRALLLLSLCLSLPAQAGLLEDDDAREQIKQLEMRVVKLEDAAKQQTKSMLDLQGQIEALNTEIRKLRGQNEEIAHGLQDAEKRQKDFYVDLDTRVRHFESAEEASKDAAAAATAAAIAKPAVVPVPVESTGPLSEARAMEVAYDFYKAGKQADAVKAFQEFLNKFPDSVQVPNVNYWLGNAQYALKDYQGALDSYQGLLKDYPDTPKTPDVLLAMAECQQKLKRPVSAHKTLKQLIAKYPASAASTQARKLLADTK
jgi:tol-pal system protein YbgF